MKKRCGIFLICFLIASFFYFWFKKSSRENPSLNSEHIKTKYGSLYQSFLIEKFSSTGLPCLSINIDNLDVEVELDLGFKRDGAFSQRFLDQIKHKMFLETVEIYGFRGNSYREKLYEIPFIQIDKIIFHNVKVLESGDEFERDSMIMQDDIPFIPAQIGRIGWGLFKNSNLFLDLKNSKIAICDSLETLKMQNYPIRHFVQAPLLLDRGIVEFYASTSSGPLRCMLDTGSTWNLLNKEVKESDIEEAIRNSDNCSVISSFGVGGKDFHGIFFHSLPLRYPIKVEAVLGMDFFRKHLVFLDFEEKIVYFSSAS